MNLRDFDIILISTSGGKDSQAMLDVVSKLAREQGVLDRCVAVHADLGRMEWAETRELAELQAMHYGVRFEVAPTRPQGDLLYQIEHQRKAFPGFGMGWFCRSDHKRGQILKVITRLVDEHRKHQPTAFPRRVKVLQCWGFTYEEGDRVDEPVWIEDMGEGISNGKRLVSRWLPIHHLSIADVWRTIRESGVPFHPAYTYGMPRLSCRFCVLANKHSLLISAEHNRELLEEYVRVEDKLGKTFKKDLKIREVLEAYDRGERGDPKKAA